MWVRHTQRVQRLFQFEQIVSVGPTGAMAFCNQLRNLFQRFASPPGWIEFACNPRESRHNPPFLHMQRRIQTFVTILFAVIKILEYVLPPGRRQLEGHAVTDFSNNRQESHDAPRFVRRAPVVM